MDTKPTMFKRIDVTLQEAATISLALRKLIPLIAGPVPPMLHGDSVESTVAWIQGLEAKYEEIVSGLTVYKDKEKEPRYAAFSDNGIMDVKL